MKTRLIPAHAGKTFSGSPSHAHSKAHPRSRGENPLGDFVRVREGGSSPLTRGKPVPSVWWPALWWLIPAHAGKTPQSREPRTSAPAHPRSRGENATPTASASVSSGSSPLTRGKHVRETQVQNRLGLIPAHAGKTEKKIESGLGGAAHPRSRGENDAVVRRLAVLPGSSPLTRGKRIREDLSAQRDGLIPAHAGKTVLVHAPASYGAAHPRSRGENSERIDIAKPRVGSSPLTRGKLRQLIQRLYERRLIPAHAGKTPSSTTASGVGRAHPRSRGENASSTERTSSAEGSSPLTRGKLPVPPDPVPDQRLIPAHAGKT